MGYWQGGGMAGFGGGQSQYLTDPDVSAQANAQKSIADVQAQTQKAVTQAQIQAQKDILGQRQTYQTGLIDRFFPFIQDVTGQALGKIGTGGGGTFGAVGGKGGYNPYAPVTLPALPPVAKEGISVGDIWNPQQVQQQVNRAVASNDQRTASQLQALEGNMAGRGYGPTSPLLQALRGNLQGKNLIANTQAQTQIPWEAAQGNAQQRLGSEQARGAIQTALQQALLQAQTAQRNQAVSAAASNQNALLQALGSMVGGFGNLGG